MPELERELRGLQVDWPSTPDLAGRVRARIETERAPAPAPRGDRRRAWRPARTGLAWAAAAVAGVAAVGLAASPSARSALLEWLGLRSVRIERREPSGIRPAAPARRHVGDTLGLGTRVTLAQARSRAGFAVRLPAGLGAPDAVYFAPGPPAGGRVSLAYGPRAGLGRPLAAGAALVVTEFRATVTPVIEKAVGAGARLERIRVAGARGYFISGRPHGFAWVDEDGRVAFEPPRLAGPTLLLESGGLLLRLEGDLTRPRALELARSLE